MLNRNNFSNKSLLKNDPPEFSPKDSFNYTPKEMFLLPSDNWKWIDEWSISDRTKETQVYFIKKMFF